MTAVLALLLVGLVSGNIVCPDGTECDDKHTCCPSNTGYACCQYPSAVCCPDMAHCCPQEYQCDLETQLCKKKGLPWYRIPFSSQLSAQEEEKNAPAPLVKSDDSSVSVVHCDNIFTCPDGTTCCRTPYGQWTCCPFTVGQCCPDGIHCCPFGYHCDRTSTQCLRGALRFPAAKQIAAMQSNSIQEEEKNAPAPLVKSDDSSVSVVHCDNIFTCPDGTTCCRTPYGQWTCCPFTVGQCCPDGIHCCPFGYHCDRTSTQCLRGALRFPAAKQIAAMQSNSIQEEEKNAPAPLVKSDDSSVSVVHCDNIYTCPDGTTCCRTPYGQWTCCPFTVGQCCPDGIHCCPFGYHCDRTSTQCLRGALRFPAAKQIAAMQSNSIQEEEKNAPAPLVKSDDSSVSVVHCDNIFTCPDGTTCCRTPYGQWTCCPFTVGQCCPDGIHCCPFGYHCDRTSTQCLRGALRFPAAKQIAAMQSNSIQEEEKNAPAPLVKSDDSSVSVVHCDNIYTCPDGTTCCRTPYGQWTCCPFTVGQCCPDGIHCCPFGYHCDRTSTQCLRGALRFPAAKQIAAMQSNSIQEKEKNAPAPLVKSDDSSVSVVHCDNIYTCPDGTTCCRTPYGQWTCCPFTVGQCCPDGIHCCPFGYHCDRTSTQCLRGALRLPAAKQIAAMQSNSIQEEEKNAPAPLVKSDDSSVSVVHCDNIYTCPDGTTCCRTPYGQWTCCPFTVGQCCPDGIHCCPFGYHCDRTSTQCLRGALRFPAAKQIAAMQSNSIQEEEKNAPAPLVKSDDSSVSVVHCDNIFTCPDGTTCCRTPYGQWTCCPFTVGQCCPDGIHCCPFGYHCDRTSTQCLRGALRLPAAKQIAAMQSNSIQD